MSDTGVPDGRRSYCPWDGIATLYPGRPGDALSREQALSAYTADAAIAEKQELHIRGSESLVPPRLRAGIQVPENGVLQCTPARPGRMEKTA